MSDDDLIRRGDAREILGDEGFLERSLERLAALPAVTPAPNAAAIREAALREARQRVNDLVAERQADLHGARNDFNRGAVDALQEACSVILALLPKGGA